MKKEEMVSLLRSAGVDENAVTLAINAWEMGVEHELKRCFYVCHDLYASGVEREIAHECAYKLKDRREDGQN
jgi:hypothetical protein